MATKRISPTRVSLTAEELEGLTVDELMKIKLTDEEKARLREINRVREQERIERSIRIRSEEAALLAELREVGCDILSVWDLVNTAHPYPQAIPILLKHLALPYSDVVKDGIARSLAVPEPKVRDAWSYLVAQYRNAPAGRGLVAPGDTKEFRLGAKDGLACALAVAVTEKTLPDLIALVKDPTQGESRALLLPALRKQRSKNPLVKQAIEDVRSDPDLQMEIASWDS